MPVRLPSAIRRGEAAELGFLYRATKLGLIVSKPYGNSAPYDFLVDNGRRLWKVQVKSSNRYIRNGFMVHCSRHRLGHTIPYEAGEVDVFACCVPAYDAWYLIPAWRIRPHLFVTVHPHQEKARKKYDLYREEWGIFAEG